MTVIVAHNAKFEILYERRFSPDTLQAFFKRGGRIWCTQYVEYLLQGQDREWHMATLDATAALYGGTSKIDVIKEMWEQGIQTSEIDYDLLMDYLIGSEDEGRNGGDIGNTEKIYLGQLKAVQAAGMMPAVLARMDGLCCTAEMEYNGLQIDMARAVRDLKRLEGELAVADKALSKYIKGLPKGFEFKWTSIYHKSAIIYGGTIKYQRQDTYIDEKTGELARKVETARWPLFDGEPVDPAHCQPAETKPEHLMLPVEGGWKYQDVFKGGKKVGQPKFKNVKVPGELKVKYQDFFHTFPGYCEPDPEWKSSVTDGKGGPIYSTASDVIDRIVKRAKNDPEQDVPFLDALGEVTRLTKEIGTYYIKIDKKTGERSGMLTCVMPETKRIHHKLNHTSTVTTRLSSSDPNLQNLTRADFDSDTGLYKSVIKAMFVSRFGANGYMVEIDYSQLEVVVMGFLSGDKNLLRDLNNRVDFHCKRVAEKNGVSYEFALDACKNENHPEYAKWSKERTRCKIFSFQRAYGAGAKLIADETGMTVPEVEELIAVEEKIYPDVAKYHKRVEAAVNASAEPYKDKNRGWRVFRKGTYQEKTGCLYTFTSQDAPSYLRRKGITDTFKPTEIKNYPTQGTGGELVQLVLGKLWRWFLKNDNWEGKALLVNTVHDCVWADVHEDVLDEVVQGMVTIMEAIPLFLKKMYGVDCPVSFPVDAECGRNMLELHHWEPKKGETE